MASKRRSAAKVASWAVGEGVVMVKWLNRVKKTMN
jgi:hypothetical protein